MARNNQHGGTTSRRAPKDLGRRVKKKPCALCRDKVEWVDYKDVPMLRKYMSDRGKIRSRRVTGNCAQHQRALAMAIKTARELVLLPYTQRTVTERPGGRGGRDRGSARSTRCRPRPRGSVPPRMRRPRARRTRGRWPLWSRPRPTPRRVPWSRSSWSRRRPERTHEGPPAGRRRRRGPPGRHRQGGGRLRPQLPPARGPRHRGHRGCEGQAEQMRRGRDFREAQDRGAAEAQATVLAGAVIPIVGPGLGRRTALRLHRPVRRGGRHQGGQGDRRRSPAHPPARAHQGDGILRGDRRTLPRRGHHRDPGGHRKLLTRAHPRPPVTPGCPSCGRADLRSPWSPVADHSCTAYPHEAVLLPTPLGALPSPGPDRQSR